MSRHVAAVCSGPGKTVAARASTAPAGARSARLGCAGKALCRLPAASSWPEHDLPTVWAHGAHGVHETVVRNQKYVIMPHGLRLHTRLRGL